MAYEDYIYTAELQDTCDADPNDTPTKAAGCRFIGQSEEGTTYNDNRPHLALAQNADLIKGQIDAAISITRVGVLSSFAANSFTIDPSGVAGNITLAAATTGSGDDITAGTPCTLVDAAGSFTAEMVGRSIIISGAANAADDGTFLITGFVNQRTIQYTNGASVGEVGGSFSYTVTNGIYLGNSNYSDSQPTRDILFQFLDENFNEVMVDGSEVKVLSVSGTIGSGFHTDGLLTVTLTDTVPSGNYRFKFGVPATLAKLPDDAFLTADIRGAQEGSGENQKPMWTVCAPAGGRGDYVGASAFEDAVANGEKRIYLKAGTYGPLTSNTALTAIDYIMGEHVDTVTIQINGNYNMTDMPSAEGFSIEVTSAAANNNHVTLAEGAVVRSVKFKSLKVFLNNDVTIENALAGGFWGCLEAPDNTTNVRVSNLLYSAADHAADQFFDIRQGCRNLVFENVYPLTPGSNLSSTGEPLVSFGGSTKSENVRFSGCYFEGAGCTILSPSNNLLYATFENCTFRNNSTSYPTVSLSSTTDVVLDNCYIVQDASTSSLGNEPLFISGSRISIRDCTIVTNATRQAVETGSLLYSSFENCSFTNDSETYAAFEVNGTCEYVTISGCLFRQSSSVSSGTNPCFLASGPLNFSSITGCYFNSSSNYAFKYESTGGADGLTIDACEFQAKSTVFSMIETLTDNIASIKNCIIRNTATAWYNEQFVVIKSRVASEYVSGLNRASSGISIENLHLEDEWCLGHDSTSNPPTTTGGTGGFPVVDLYGVSGSNLSFDREDLDYNVENGVWLSMENCRIDNVAVHVDGTAPMTPHTYTAGTVSNGIIEVKGVSHIRGLRFGSRLVDEVSRSVIWAQSASDMDVADDTLSSRQAVIEDVQVNFDDGSAVYDSLAANQEGIAMTLAGNVHVSGFVWNGDCKVATAEVVGPPSVPATTSIVGITGSYNTLDRAHIRHDCSIQGSVDYLISVDALNYYGNRITNCVVKSKLDVPPDDGTAEYPQQVVSLPAGQSCLVDGCDLFVDGTPVSGSLFRFIASASLNNYRFSNNSMVLNGDLDSHATGDVVVDGGALGTPNGTCVGNAIAVRQGTTAPTVSVRVAAGNDLTLDTTTTKYPSL